MQIRFVNATLLAMKKDVDIQYNMQVWVEDDKISFVGTNEEADLRAVSEKEVPYVTKDCRGNLLMPGFKNAHTHSAMTFLRSKADDTALHDWLNNLVFPAEAKLLPEDIYALTKLAILEYLQSGITGIFDMYMSPDAIAKACEELGMRATIVGGLNDFSQSVAEIRTWVEKYNKSSSLVRFLPGFHAEYTTGEEILKELASYVNENKLPVFAHISETSSEVEGCIGRHGMTPLAYLDSLHLFDYGGGGYHMIYATDEELEICRKKGLYLITNPSSNLKLASGFAPVDKWLEKGLSVAIGTDGPASNNALDFFREMFLTATLSKAQSLDPTVVSAGDVLRMACTTGAHAMGVMQSDSLDVGKNADMIMLDLKQPNMQPIHNIVNNIVYAGNKINVCMTMIGGKILYENNEFYLSQSYADIIKEANNACDRIFS